MKKSIIYLLLSTCALLWTGGAAKAAGQTPEKVYNIAMVEQKPEFPGGEAALYKWLSENVVYPAEAKKDGVEGRVIVEFKITANGSIENARVLRSLHPALDKEALRVVNAMPQWSPGRMNGKPVKVTYMLPITFMKKR